MDNQYIWKIQIAYKPSWAAKRINIYLVRNKLSIHTRKNIYKNTNIKRLRLLLKAILPDIMQPNYSGLVSSSTVDNCSVSICNATACQYIYKTSNYYSQIQTENRKWFNNFDNYNRNINNNQWKTYWKPCFDDENILLFFNVIFFVFLSKSFKLHWRWEV